MLRAMIVSGSRAIRQSLGSVITSYEPGISFVEAKGVRDCLRLVALHAPDVIFLSIPLPDGSGLELTRKLVAAHPTVKICIISWIDLPEYRVEAKSSGADFFVSPESLSMNTIAVVLHSIPASNKQARRSAFL